MPAKTPHNRKPGRKATVKTQPAQTRRRRLRLRRRPSGALWCVGSPLGPNKVLPAAVEEAFHLAAPMGSRSWAGRTSTHYGFAEAARLLASVAALSLISRTFSSRRAATNARLTPLTRPPIGVPPDVRHWKCDRASCQPSVKNSVSGQFELGG